MYSFLILENTLKQMKNNNNNNKKINDFYKIFEKLVLFNLCKLINFNHF